MKVSPKHLLEQGPVVRTLLQAVLDAVPPIGPFTFNGKAPSSKRSVYRETVPPRA